MPQFRHAFAIAAAILALTPAAPLAQGAGDEQYSDPFRSAEAAPTPTPPPPPPPPPRAPPGPAPPPAPPAPPAAPAAAPAAAPRPTLPYTGAEEWLTAG